MARYVCDFDQVYSCGEKVCKIASDLNAAIDSYSSSINSDLSTWSGSSREAFDASNSDHITSSSKDIEFINSFGEFIRSFSEKVQSLEDELASLDI